MDMVTVKAEQRFDDWQVGDVRTVGRTPYIEAVIRTERLTVVAEIPKKAPAPNTTETEANSPVEEQAPDVEAAPTKPDTGTARRARRTPATEE